MPYITQTARQVIADGGPVSTAGELNYMITQSILHPFQFTKGPRELIENYIKYHGLSYSIANDIVGSLECARREFKRRRGINMKWLSEIADEFYDEKVAPYEDQKIQLNGDVY